jgi:hypothetical protein
LFIYYDVFHRTYSPVRTSTVKQALRRSYDNTLKINSRSNHFNSTLSSSTSSSPSSSSSSSSNKFNTRIPLRSTELYNLRKEAKNHILIMNTDLKLLQSKITKLKQELASATVFFNLNL